MMNTEQAAASLGISQNTIYKWIESGRLVPSDERGYYNAALFTPEEVERAREQRASELVADLERLGYDVALNKRQ